MIGIMKILLDADILLEAVLNRNIFIDEIEKLFEIFTLNNIEVFISELGLSRINSTMKIFNTSKKMRGVFFKVKKPLKKLKITETIAKKAKLLAVDDFESAVEISLAIEANIGAIITHKPDDFSGGEFNILTLTDFQQRHKMEASASGDTNELLARWTIPLEKLLNLNKILHLSPSYTDIKSLEPKESTSQLDLTCSSDKVSTSPTDKLLPQSNARSISQIIIDALLNPSTAQVDIAKFGSLESERLTCKSSFDTLKASIERNQLSIKSSARSTAYVDVAKLHSLGRESLTCKTSIDILKVGIDRDLSIKSPIPQPIRQLKSTRFGGLTAPVPQPYENSLGSKLREHELQMEKWLSLAVDSASIKPPIPQLIRQLESTRFGGLIAPAPQPYENSLGSKLRKRIDHSSKINSLLKVDHSFSDRYGLLSQFKLLESMNKANVLESYLSRKN